MYEAATSQDPDYLVAIHDQGTKPNIIQEHYLVPAKGITSINFKMTQVSLLSRPYNMCRQNVTVPYWYTGRGVSDVDRKRHQDATFQSPAHFLYRKIDCFWSKMQKQIFKNCSCISPYAGVRQEYINAQVSQPSERQACSIHASFFILGMHQAAGYVTIRAPVLEALTAEA